MPAKYKLVLRKDMRKGAEADAKLYYANAKAAGTVGIQELCDLIAEGSTASAKGKWCRSANWEISSCSSAVPAR